MGGNPNLPAVPQNTGLVKDPLLAMAESLEVPRALQEHFKKDDWVSMTVGQRMEAISFFQDEQGETTRGLKITFPRIRYPTAQAPVWVIPGGGVNGKDGFETTIAGVVLFKQPVRAYWPIDKPIAKDPPVCSSPDAKRPDTPGPITEKGRQSDYCATCPKSAFGTGKEGSGQACKYLINCFLLRDVGGEELRAPLVLEDIPTHLRIPPSQLKAFSEYAVQIRKNVPSGSLLAYTTIFGLKDDRSRNGTEFKSLVLSLGKKLDYPTMKRCREMSDSFIEQFQERGFEPDEEGIIDVDTEKGEKGEKVPF